MLNIGSGHKNSASAKNIGVVFDSSLNFRKHIYPKHVAHASMISVTCVEFEKNLSLDLAKQIAVALVSSKLDYCNSLFHNMPEKYIARLQRCLARVVTKTPRFSRSVLILKRLHWLLVKFRIHFKICAITF